MSTVDLLAVVGVGLLIILAALLAAAETAITRMSSARAESLEEEGRRGAITLRRVVENRESTINPVLFVLLASHLATATVVAVFADRRWGVEGAVIGFSITLAVVFVAAEAIPKAIALADPDRTALRLAPFVRALSLVAPLRWIAKALLALAAPIRPSDPESSSEVTEEELLALAGEAVASESIDMQEREFIESIITFGDTVVREVMVPRPDMVVVEAGFRIADALEVAILNGYSRLPTIGDGIDDIVGIIHAKDLMRAQRDDLEAEPVTGILRASRFVPETKRVAELLREMQAETFHLAIVVDEYGGTAGLVTLEDLIEELVGEIVDEFDVEKPLIERVDDHHFRVNGRVPIADLEHDIGVELPEGDWDTVGGFIFNSLGHIPVEGETLDANGHLLTVERVQGRRIARVRIDVGQPVDDHEVAGEPA